MCGDGSAPGPGESHHRKLVVSVGCGRRRIRALHATWARAEERLAKLGLSPGSHLLPQATSPPVTRKPRRFFVATKSAAGEPIEVNSRDVLSCSIDYDGPRDPAGFAKAVADHLADLGSCPLPVPNETGERHLASFSIAFAPDAGLQSAVLVRADAAAVEGAACIASALTGWNVPELETGTMTLTFAISNAPIGQK